jgi:diaminopimelate epimerase
MQLRFTKMQGLGNDFVVFDAINQRVELNADQYRKLADRHFGIGCDQILLIEPARLAQTDFHYRIFNADGSEVEQCGNGARCFARFVHDKGLTPKRQIPVGTAAGRILLSLESDGLIRVNMGNPHAVLAVDAVESAPVAQLGPQIENHPDFPQRVNVGFMQRLDRQHIKLRVYERGSGETLACGSGACAAVVTGRLQGLLDARVQVNLPGGELVIEWEGEDTAVMMSGPAETVFEGTIEL